MTDFLITILLLASGMALMWSALNGRGPMAGA